MFGALYLVLSSTLAQRERTPLHEHGQEHGAPLPSSQPTLFLLWAGAPAQLPRSGSLPHASEVCSWVNSRHICPFLLLLPPSLTFAHWRCRPDPPLLWTQPCWVSRTRILSCFAPGVLVLASLAEVQQLSQTMKALLDEIFGVA